MRLINADALRARFQAILDRGDMFCEYDIIGMVDNAPTVKTFTLEDIEEQYRKGLEKGLSEWETERPRGKWIPVSERLPEDMQKVLVWFEYYRYGDYNCMYQTYGFGYVCDGEWSRFINGESGWQDARIIAWLPLPEPYKEVSNDHP